MTFAYPALWVTVFWKVFWQYDYFYYCLVFVFYEAVLVLGSLAVYAIFQYAPVYSKLIGRCRKEYDKAYNFYPQY